MKIFKFSQDFLLTYINISSLSENDMILADADNTPAHRAREATQLLQREISSSLLICSHQIAPNWNQDCKIWGDMHQRVYETHVNNQSINHLFVSD